MTVLGRATGSDNEGGRKNQDFIKTNETRVVPFEHRCPEGLIRVVQVRTRWRVDFGGARTAGSWPSAEAAVAAVARHASGLAALDRLEQIDAPSDLIDWTPTGANI